MRLALPLVLSLAACDTYLAPVEGADDQARLVAVQTALILEDCDDGIDNDGNGKVDDQDPACKSGFRNRWGGHLGYDVDSDMEGNDWYPTDDWLAVKTGAWGDVDFYYNPNGSLGKYGMTEITDSRGTLIGTIHHLDSEALTLNVVIAAGDTKESLIIETKSGFFWAPSLDGDWSTEALPGRK